MPDGLATSAAARGGGAAGERPTLKTIAYMTGLGVTTVSRALNDAPDIGQATKERVRLVAKQIGYRPNRAGVRLRTGKTNVISLILSVETEVLGLTSHLVYGISEYLAGYALPPDRHALPRCGATRSTRCATSSRPGRRTASSSRGPSRRTRACATCTSAAFPSRPTAGPRWGSSIPIFDFDNARYAEIAVERLAARGRRRLALLPPPAHLTYARPHDRGLPARRSSAHDLIDVPVRGVDHRQRLRGDPGRDRPADGRAAPAGRLRLRQRRGGDLRDRGGRGPAAARSGATSTSRSRSRST